jgi:heat-inducible transcriptional repressor
VRARLHEELRQLRADMSELMTAALRSRQPGDCRHLDPVRHQRRKEPARHRRPVVQHDRLRRLFDLFEQRTGLAQLLELSSRAEGVQVFIGGESGIAPLDECSVVAAPYEVDGQIVGTIGVIGPTRMAYERVIPIVDITAKLLSSALSAP